MNQQRTCGEELWPIWHARIFTVWQDTLASRGGYWGAPVGADVVITPLVNTHSKQHAHVG